MHYVGLAAKILIRHVVDGLPLCKSSRKRSPTIFEVLSGSWTAPGYSPFREAQVLVPRGPGSRRLCKWTIMMAR